MEGGYQFLDCIIAPDACSQMNRCVENIEHLNCIDKEGFFVSYCDAPMKSDDAALRHYVRQMQTHVLTPLQEKFGIDIRRTKMLLQSFRLNAKRNIPQLQVRKKTI